MAEAGPSQPMDVEEEDEDRGFNAEDEEKLATRWQITPDILAILQQVYSMDPFPSTEVRKQLANKLKSAYSALMISSLDCTMRVTYSVKYGGQVSQPKVQNSPTSSASEIVA